MRQLAELPALATAAVEVAATRQAAEEYWFEEIVHYVYPGDTAAHLAAASYQFDVVRALLAAGANVRARNRRGAAPLHYAADGHPDFPMWNPTAQATTIAYLIEGGVDPNAADKSGVTPLHRAVRTRCAAAVQSLIAGGANPNRRNNNGSSPIQLATQPTGRGGSGSDNAKAQQAEIVTFLAAL